MCYLSRMCNYSPNKINNTMNLARGLRRLWKYERNEIQYLCLKDLLTSTLWNILYILLFMLLYVVLYIMFKHFVLLKVNDLSAWLPEDNIFSNHICVFFYMQSSRFLGIHVSENVIRKINWYLLCSIFWNFENNFDKNYKTNKKGRPKRLRKKVF